MSIEALCSIHDLDIYNIVETVGDAFGTVRTLALRNSVKCRVIPLSSADQVQLGNQLGKTVTHRLRFSADPNIQETNWVKWRRLGGNVVTMRPRGVPTDAHGLGRMWQVLADAHSWQSENLDVQVE